MNPVGVVGVAYVVLPAIRQCHGEFAGLAQQQVAPKRVACRDGGRESEV